MSELRSKLIRVAYTHPELRGDLLPLITAAEKQEAFKLDPDEVFGALKAIAKDPARYGVKDADKEKLADLLKTLNGAEHPDTKTASPFSKAMSLVAKGVETVNAAIHASRHVAEHAPKLKKVYDGVMKNSLGISYSMVCLGVASTLARIAPDHPIAQHASEWDTQVAERAKDLPLLEKMRAKTLHVVKNMSDDEVEVSIGMMRKVVEKLKGPPRPKVSDDFVQSSVKVHRSLQTLYGEFVGEHIEHKPHGDKKPSKGEAGHSYDDYVEKKKRDGGHPMSRKDWEARYGK